MGEGTRLEMATPPTDEGATSPSGHPMRGLSQLLPGSQLTFSCGLQPGVAERLDKEAPDWRTSGKFAVISFAPKTA